MQKRKTKKTGGNLHCIMAFQRSLWQGAKKEDTKHDQSASRNRLSNCSKPEVRAGRTQAWGESDTDTTDVPDSARGSHDEFDRDPMSYLSDSEIDCDPSEYEEV